MVNLQEEAEMARAVNYKVEAALDELQKLVEAKPASMREYALVKTKLEEAQHWLHHRFTAFGKGPTF